MPYHLMLDLSSTVIEDRRNVRSDILTLNEGNQKALPVFTHMDPFFAFLRARYTRAHRVNLAPLQIDPFELAGVAEPMKKTGRIEFIAFNPVHTRLRKRKNVLHLEPVEKYCRFMREVHPYLEKYAADTAAKFPGLTPGTEAYYKSLLWDAPRLDRISEEAQARIRESEAD